MLSCPGRPQVSVVIHPAILHLWVHADSQEPLAARMCFGDHCLGFRETNFSMRQPATLPCCSRLGPHPPAGRCAGVWEACHPHRPQWAQRDLDKGRHWASAGGCRQALKSVTSGKLIPHDGPQMPGALSREQQCMPILGRVLQSSREHAKVVSVQQGCLHPVCRPGRGDVEVSLMQRHVCLRMTVSVAVRYGSGPASTAVPCLYTPSPCSEHNMPACTTSRLHRDRQSGAFLRESVGHALWVEYRCHYDMGAAGAIEAVFAVKALVHSLAPPLLNLWKHHPPVLGNLAGQATALPPGPKAVMSNSFGFGGTNTSLVFASPPRLDDWDL